MRSPVPRLSAALSAALFLALTLGAGAALGKSVFVAEMTWPEVRAALAMGTRTVIIPTGGIEQGGPHLVIGKHNHIVRHTAEVIARTLGDALVAQVVAYTPQGSIAPPMGHMKYPGTVSMPGPVFRSILENITRSFKAHGFRQILFLGDSGGNQQGQAAVAGLLNREWAGTGAGVLHISDYYDPERNGQFAWLRAHGKAKAAKGGHAGLRDTSELMAVYPGGVRDGQIGAAGTNGVMGDPNGASPAMGKSLLELKIKAALTQIKRWRATLKD